MYLWTSGQYHRFSASSHFLLWIWGWVKYVQAPNNAGWHARASLVGRSAPALSAAVWSHWPSICSWKVGWPSSKAHPFDSTPDLGCRFSAYRARNGRACRSSSTNISHRSSFNRQRCCFWFTTMTLPLQTLQLSLTGDGNTTFTQPAKTFVKKSRPRKSQRKGWPK